MSLKLLVRADAGESIGSGHVMRCLALAEACRSDGGNVQFLCTDLPESLHRRLAEASFGVAQVQVESGGMDDVVATLRCCQSAQPDWVVLDGYSFKSAYQQQLKAAGRRLMVIDDDGCAGSYAADIVLNQNMDVSPDLYPRRAAYTRMLLGSRYALLRPEFFRQRADAKVRSRATRILVTFGASDRHNVSSFVLRCLARLSEPHFEVVVVAGATNPHRGELKIDAARYAMRVDIVEDPPSMAEFMDWADIAITAGGSTCWELAYLGVPMIVIVVADNQFAIAAALGGSGGQINLGWFENLSESGVSKQLRSLVSDSSRRQEMADTARQLIDGRGAQRVIHELDLAVGHRNELCVSG